MTKASVMKAVTMTTEYGAPFNETFPNSDGWTCVLKYKGKQYTVHYYMGYGLNGKEPRKKDVLESLLLDASGYDNAKNYEDFADEFGYDPDSRKGEKVYNACGKVSKNMHRLFTKDELSALWEEVQE